jgi:hypothetical protein
MASPGILKRFLSARADVPAEVVENCRTLNDQLDVISTLPGWPAIGDTGVTMRSFLEAVMHIIQLQFFFGVPADKVSFPECCCTMIVEHTVEGVVEVEM